jgi:hypothetical protein
MTPSRLLLVLLLCLPAQVVVPRLQGAGSGGPDVGEGRALAPYDWSAKQLYDP